MRISTIQYIYSVDNFYKTVNKGRRGEGGTRSVGVLRLLTHTHYTLSMLNDNKIFRTKFAFKSFKFVFGKCMKRCAEKSV